VDPKVSLIWSFEPPVLPGVLALGAIYLYAWRRARTPAEPHPPGYGRLALFAAGLVTILVALVSPLDSLGDQLMVMHMVQHILLLDLAPILLLLGLTKVLLRPATRRLNTIERRAGFLAHPALAVIAYAGVLWLWHLPALYDRAQGNGFLHALEHVCFFTAGFLYWWYVFSPIRSRNRLKGLGPVAYMTSAKLLVGLLGVYLAFDPHSIFSFY
jgi:cytochrome c oxidase assembly factor CtaG